MNLTTIATTSASTTRAMTEQNIPLIVQKKAMDADAATATALINAAVKPANLPPNLGGSINTTA